VNTTASPIRQSNFASVPHPMFMCPGCGGEIDVDGGSLSCTRCGNRYELLDGIPVFASPHSGGRAELPFLYDAAQVAFGGRRSVKRVGAHLDRLAPASVLDVGGGTGFYAGAVPTSARYVVADTDVTKLRRLKKHLPHAGVVVADATNLPIRSDAIDVALFIAVAHHLRDKALELALAELARVARGRVLFLDPLAGGRLPSRALWRLDRGSFPRSADELTDLATNWFELERVERYSIRHDYVLWVGRPHGASVL
jgi:SAM-dependent methyltransferase